MSVAPIKTVIGKISNGAVLTMKMGGAPVIVDIFESNKNRTGKLLSLGAPRIEEEVGVAMEPDEDSSCTKYNVTCGSYAYNAPGDRGVIKVERNNT
ncbi:hypothetical protein [Halorubrum sp. AJ67]|uniref:hypothetical protein n=1 Tax=Halorubrum sp. AJ67 TaxID=1173487 RepID=UPI0012ABEDA8|nr:hypothetical protein [Halorubrum sp. AJ67]